MKMTGVGKWCLAAWPLESTADGLGVAGRGGVGGWPTSYDNIGRLVHCSREDGRGSK